MNHSLVPTFAYRMRHVNAGFDYLRFHMPESISMKRGKKGTPARTSLNMYNLDLQQKMMRLFCEHFTYLARWHVGSCLCSDIDEGAGRFELNHSPLHDFPSLEAHLQSLSNDGFTDEIEHRVL